MRQREYKSSMIWKGGGYRRYKIQVDRYHITCTIDVQMNYNYYSKEKHTNNQQDCTEQIMKNTRKIIINGFYTITIFTVLSMLIH